LLEAIAIEALLHREASPEQADGPKIRSHETFGCGICDVQERDRDGGLDLGGDLMHGVRTEDEELGPRPLRDL
jgi:hypothetical protein